MESILNHIAITQYKLCWWKDNAAGEIYIVEDKSVGKNIETTEDIVELIGDVIIITAE